ncbi:LysR family transcriptional regulator [Vibrio sp. 10N.261.46.E12]|uniref:LysR family transcriptional regulator n=1 Tax=unclassified Vibrio TaxID=2614977 RepID=UPI00097792DE|nr:MULTISPECIES: LysR family transcriptional regulator [unclassified Vibrio]OMO33720.1 LysR family transcriptional regulator [Vibrio sp. 10N.261.45.E1]PMJ36802.1 LysR family transcriptional regulator [Vibrio sp. 10N.286.45.B6]PML82906.1 LysR family transcriptional regulator [Vibrio sp. 10N.261.49.E11]PMM65710.1 LysR family transcriptional regulator [Vibrio sp. 10N.261.46.F12]PMM78990.1 LysR family transcriptional regulator [Vibrio sp. 10N.261.46.E8]
MTMKELQYFVTLIRSNSFTKASEQLYVTQPTISKALKSLENTYGQALIYRNGRDIALTDAGQIVFEYAQSILFQQQELEVRLNDLQQLKSGKITLGIPPMVGHLYTHLIQRFSQRYPDIEVSIVESGSRKLEAAVLEGEIDIAITMLSEPNPKFNTWAIGNYPIFAVLPKTEQWQPIEKLDIADLQSLTFYLYSPEFILSEVITKMCLAHGFTPKIGVRSSQWDFLAAMVKSGLGVSFMPEPICNRLNPNDYCFIQVEQNIRWELAAIWSNEHYVSRASQAMLDVIRSSEKQDSQ